MLVLILLLLLSFGFQVKSQIILPPFDTLDREDIKLQEIDLIYGNSYKFRTNIVSDSLIFIVPPFLAKGYYEAYYKNDSNRLALAYYNFGNKSYVQQFYADGSMKSDSEYDRLGNMHGMHTVFDRNGEEIWHADYWHGALDSKYSFDYLNSYNYTAEFITSDKAWGCYEFRPSPMRERHDQIALRKDGTFSYHNFKADCDCRRHSEGNWTFENGLLSLHADKKDIWLNKSTRHFALIALRKSQNPILVELSAAGLNWYASEYRFCKKCNCISVSEND